MAACYCRPRCLASFHSFKKAAPKLSAKKEVIKAIAYSFNHCISSTRCRAIADLTKPLRSRPSTSKKAQAFLTHNWHI
jgi:hypothetical protein